MSALVIRLQPLPKIITFFHLIGERNCPVTSGDKETEEENTDRLSKQAEYQTQIRMEESPQETIDRKLKDSRWHAKKHENETLEETSKLLSYQAYYQQTHGDYIQHYNKRPSGPDDNPYTEKEWRYYI